MDDYTDGKGLKASKENSSIFGSDEFPNWVAVSGVYYHDK